MRRADPFSLSLAGLIFWLVVFLLRNNNGVLPRYCGAFVHEKMIQDGIAPLLRK